MIMLVLTMTQLGNSCVLTSYRRVESHRLVSYMACNENAHHWTVYLFIAYITNCFRAVKLSPVLFCSIVGGEKSKVPLEGGVAIGTKRPGQSVMDGKLTEAKHKRT